MSHVKKPKALVIQLLAVAIGLFAVNAATAQTRAADFEVEKKLLANGRPDHFPTPPKNSKSLFFIQRNTNRNTIVYDANMTARGEFNSSNPMDVYWLRYASTGHRMELTWMQRNLAYGYKSSKDNTGKGHWINLTAYDGRKIHLRKDSAGRPVAVMNINGKPCRLDYIWVFTEGPGSWPTVLHLDLHGRDMASGKPVVERIVNK